MLTRLLPPSPRLRQIAHLRENLRRPLMQLEGLRHVVVSQVLVDFGVGWGKEGLGMVDFGEENAFLSSSNGC